MNYCQLGHFHLGLSTGILAAICQEPRAAQVAFVIHVPPEQQTCCSFPAAITHPTGHTAGPQPPPPQGTSLRDKNLCLNEAMLISCMPQV